MMKQILELPELLNQSQLQLKMKQLKVLQLLWGEPGMDSPFLI
jgi:hypothetical protein